MAKHKFNGDRGNTFKGAKDSKVQNKGIIVSSKTSGQKRLIVEIKNNDVVICTGPAGSGKTYISTGMALQHLLAPGSEIKKIVFMRPAKEACDEHLGALPGELSEKMAPWIQPIIDNMMEFLPPPDIKNLFWEKKIEVVPLAYARGRSLNRSFIIVDEAQNCSDKQMLMVLTRIGEGSKMVINGDLDQSDSMHVVNGLADAATRLYGINGIGVVSMDSVDIVRNPMIREIIRRYKDEPLEPVTAHEVILEAMAT